MVGNKTIVYNYTTYVVFEQTEHSYLGAMQRFRKFLFRLFQFLVANVRTYTSKSVQRFFLFIRLSIGRFKR